MINGMGADRIEAGLPLGLSSKGKAVQARDAEHRVMYSVALQAAVAEDLPALHSSEGVLDAGANPAV